MYWQIKITKHLLIKVKFLNLKNDCEANRIHQRMDKGNREFEVNLIELWDKLFDYSYDIKTFVRDRDFRFNR